LRGDAKVNNFPNNRSKIYAHSRIGLISVRRSKSLRFVSRWSGARVLGNRWLCEKERASIPKNADRKITPGERKYSRARLPWT